MYLFKQSIALGAVLFYGFDLTTNQHIDAKASEAWLNEKVSVDRSLNHPLIQEVGERLMAHAQWMVLDPKDCLEWRASVGGDATHQALSARFKTAKQHLWEPSAQLWQKVQTQRNKRSLRNQVKAWMHKALPFEKPGSDVLQPNSMDLVLSNLSLHHEASPHVTITQWSKALRAQGVVLFSVFGPDTLQEVHSLYQAKHWPTPAHPLTDMHDWGDLLVQSGFSDPVLDMERIELTYTDAKTFLLDMRCLGRNLSPHRFGALRGRDFFNELSAALNLRKSTLDGRFSMTFEVIYGHAFKAPVKERPSPEVKLDLESVRAQLRKSRS